MSEEEEFISVNANGGERSTVSEIKEKSASQDDLVDKKTLFVRSIPFDVTSEELSDFFSQFCPVKHAVVVTDREKNSRGFGFVSLALDDDAKLALEKSRKTKLKGRLLRVDIANRRDRKHEKTSSGSPAIKEPHGEAVEKRKARLIVRNLPWSIRKPEQLSRIFSKYGAITDVIIPRKNGGRMSGFAFITMKKNASAEKAIKESAGLKIDGREVAVDFAIEKNKWEEYVKENQPEIKEEEKDNDDGNAGEDESSSESENDMEEESDSKDDDNADENTEATEQELEDLNDLDKVEIENDEDEQKKPEPKNKLENYSIFIRNIPYDATEESLKEHFEQFGPVKYALPVIDKTTGLAKGTAFVAFYQEETYNEVLSNAPEANATSILISDDVSPLYVYEGRILSITPTVNRQAAEGLASKNAERRSEILGKAPGERDKRNLFLLNEGRITANSKLSSFISKTDLELREKSYKLRVQQLNKNPTLHVSLTRLALRNLPRALTEKSLKALGRKAVVEFSKELKEGKRHPLSKEEIIRSTKYKHFLGELNENGEESKKSKKKGVVRQAKIIMEVKGSGTAGRSRGYGFLEFRDHKSALMGLRWLNAHEVSQEEILEGLDEEEKKYIQLEGSTKRRLIVEFAIENAQVIKRRSNKILNAKNNRNDDEKSNMNKGQKNSNNHVENVSEDKSGVSDDVKKLIGAKRKRKKVASKGRN
ncbi:hypothetical protein PACTADRAFT_44185 [Pachysolen tannophilus NRRL Y-2460]|uniref:RRM domain-containing protein n=1 Tax=Pachysolen tannophilus NRRL Y-2460 TaxID=669874 RepID=A0A1E4TTA3_PACTA|nr:hypothetical protein PACTADRAFT_44185 [Pachysolen tannophilus NRRL Y-2460]